MPIGKARTVEEILPAALDGSRACAAPSAQCRRGPRVTPRNIAAGSTARGLALPSGGASGWSLSPAAAARHAAMTIMHSKNHDPPARQIHNALLNGVPTSGFAGRYPYINSSLVL